MNNCGGGLSAGKPCALNWQPSGHLRSLAKRVLCLSAGVCLLAKATSVKNSLPRQLIAAACFLSLSRSAAGVFCILSNVSVVVLSQTAALDESSDDKCRNDNIVCLTILPHFITYLSYPSFRLCARISRLECCARRATAAECARYLLPVCWRPPVGQQHATTDAHHYCTLATMQLCCVCV